MKTGDEVFKDLEAQAKAFCERYPSVSRDEVFHWLFWAYNRGTRDATDAHAPAMSALAQQWRPRQGLFDRLVHWLYS